MQNISLFVRPRLPRSSAIRRTLRLGTCLSGAAVALLSGMSPAIAGPLLNSAPPATSISPSYRLTPPVLRGAAPQRAAPQIRPQDLTVRPNASLAVTQSMAADDVVIHDGDVANTADNTPGIAATSDGNITITANTVTTSGYGSHGVDATGSGAISISAGAISTSGDHADGVYAHSSGGPVDVTVDLTTTSGLASRGIDVSGTDVSVAVGSVRTTGVGGAGIVAYGNGPGATVDLTVNGQLKTYGSFATGIVAVSDGSVAIHDNGAITTSGSGGFHGFGGHAGGIRAYATGDITIDGGGTVTTSGPASIGVQAASFAGDITIDLGSVSTAGGVSNGILATTVSYDPYTYQAIVGGKVSITVDDVSTSGAYSVAVAALGRAVEVTLNDALTTQGSASQGIVVRAYDGDAVIHNKGSITTSGVGGSGINAVAAGDIVVDGGGSITVVGKGSAGITAISQGGSISISQGNITSSGGGVYAYAMSGYDIGDGSKSVSIDVGDVTTGSSGATARGIVAENSNYQGAISIAAGSVATRGDYATGVVAYSRNGAVTITGDGVATRGLGASGIFAEGASVDVAEGTVATEGDGAFGISALSLAERPGAAPGHINIDVDTLSTLGSGSTGIVARSYNGSIDVNVGTLTTQGDNSLGIYALSRAGSGHVDITAGDVSTKGDNSVAVAGILAADGELKITVTGSISTAGKDADGILAATGFGNVDVTTGSITTSGELAPAMIAYSVYGTASIKTGAVSTSGNGSTGVFVEGGSGVQASIDSIKTGGIDADGLVIRTGGYQGSADTNIHVGSIATSGDGSFGIEALTAFGTDSITVGSISTLGGIAPGIDVRTYGGEIDLHIGSVSTKGNYSKGIDAVAKYGASVTVGTVSTTGAYSAAIRALSDGNVTVTSSGPISTSGTASAGIIAWSGIPLLEGGNGSEQLPTNPLVSVTASQVTTSGAGSIGIFARNDYGAISVDAANVTTKGAGSIGIAALGTADVTVKAGSVSSSGTAIYANGSGTMSFDVSGAVTSLGQAAISAENAGGGTVINVRSGGSVIGGGQAGADGRGAGDGIWIASGGKVTITNAGTIGTAGNGYAIDIEDDVAPGARTSLVAGGSMIDNSGTIMSAVKLGGGDDVVTNRGTFVATKDSNFGGGVDSFVNSGVLSVRLGAKPGTISFLGLEAFNNAGGLVDLRDGVAGDTLMLPGNYVGSGKAVLGLDLGVDGTADTLVVAGAATGSTMIQLNAAAGNATLLAKPVTLVRAGAGSAANAFNIADPSIGFVQYGLGFNAATNVFSLTTQAGAPVYRLAKISEAAQASWQESASAWDAHMTELRDLAEPVSRIWGQAYGKVDTRHESRTVAVAGGTPATYDLGYRQDYYGGQAGFDIGGRQNDDDHGFVFGATTGYLSSHLNFHAGADKAQIETLNFGIYGTLRAGPLFVNLLGQYDHYWVKVDDRADQWSARFGGSGYGAETEVGARFGSDGLFAEPLASLAWQRTDLGTLSALGQKLDFDADTALTGKLGARIGGNIGLGGTARAVFYAKANFVHQFSGKSGVLFESGGTSEDVTGTRVGDYGQGAIGLNVLTAGRVSGFIEGDADVGGSTKGGGGRVGIRFRL